MCFGRGEMRVAEGRRPEKHEEHDDAEGPQVDLRAREESRQRSPQWTSRLRSPLRRKAAGESGDGSTCGRCASELCPDRSSTSGAAKPGVPHGEYATRERAGEASFAFDKPKSVLGWEGSDRVGHARAGEEGREPGKAHDGASQPAAAVASGRAKVGGARAQLRAPSSIEKHVFRFQISVDDADEVQRGEARGDLADDFSRVRFRQFPLALEQPEQGASRQQLKNQLHLRGRFEGVDKLRVVAVAAWRWSPVAGRRRRRIHT